LQRCSVITTKTIRTVCWDISHRGNTDVSGQRQLKIQKLSGNGGSRTILRLDL